jgi:YggT family protein
MTPVEQVGMLVVNTFVGLYLLVVILRFLLQLVRADFYNPISQFIVKATNPLLVPMRKVIPGFGGIDVASLVLALLVQTLGIALILMINNIMPVPQILLWAVIGVLSLILKIYFWGLLISVIASWIAPGSYNPALILIGQILEPVTRPVRKMLPDMGGLDISPIILFLLIQVVEILVVRGLAQMAGMPSGLVMGI